MSTLIIVMTSMLTASTAGQSDFRDLINYDKKVRVAETINFVKPSKANPYIKVSREAGITYEELRFYALHECKNNSNPPARLIDNLIDIEKRFDPPPEMRGMLLAAACTESGYNPFARGDRKFSKSGKKPMAVGIMQLWPVWERMFPGLDRQNPQQSANAWMTHIVSKIPKVKRQCKYRTKPKIWLAAWVTGIRYKKIGGRCNERPTHYRLLKKWHRNILKDREKDDYCRSKETCGC